MHKAATYTFYVSYIVSLAFAIAAIYLGSVGSTCNSSVPANRWLISIGSLELFALFAMLVSAVFQLFEKEKSTSLLVLVDCCYAVVRLILIGLGLAALDCVLYRDSIIAMLVFQGLAISRASLLLFHKLLGP